MTALLIGRGPAEASPDPPLRLERRHCLAALAILVVFFAPYQTLVQTVTTDDSVRLGSGLSPDAHLNRLLRTRVYVLSVATRGLILLHTVAVLTIVGCTPPSYAAIPGPWRAASWRRRP
jgi:hypothetical protein